jgi:hypothetical protein
MNEPAKDGEKYARREQVLDALVFALIVLVVSLFLSLILTN